MMQMTGTDLAVMNILGFLGGFVISRWWSWRRPESIESQGPAPSPPVQEYRVEVHLRGTRRRIYFFGTGELARPLMQQLRDAMTRGEPAVIQAADETLIRVADVVAVELYRSQEPA